MLVLCAKLVAEQALFSLGVTFMLTNLSFSIAGRKRPSRRVGVTSVMLVLVLSVAGCGFQPRGSVTELADPGAIFVDVSRGVTLRSDLQVALQERAFRIANNRDVADILLRISDEEQSQRIVSIQSTGRVSELELSHAVKMQVAQGQGGEPPAYDPEQPGNRVDVIREYTNDTRGVLGKEQEAEILREEMRQELVRQVVLRTVATLVER